MKKTKASLKLKLDRQTIRSLGEPDLALVAGGAKNTLNCPTAITCECTSPCVTQFCTVGC